MLHADHFLVLFRDFEALLQLPAVHAKTIKNIIGPQGVSPLFLRTQTGEQKLRPQLRLLQSEMSHSLPLLIDHIDPLVSVAHQKLAALVIHWEKSRNRHRLPRGLALRGDNLNTLSRHEVPHHYLYIIKVRFRR